MFFEKKSAENDWIRSEKDQLKVVPNLGALLSFNAGLA